MRNLLNLLIQSGESHVYNRSLSEHQIWKPLNVIADARASAIDINQSLLCLSVDVQLSDAERMPCTSADASLIRFTDDN